MAKAAAFSLFFCRNNERKQLQLDESNPIKHVLYIYIYIKLHVNVNLNKHLCFIVDLSFYFVSCQPSPQLFDSNGHAPLRPRAIE
jgi:hypothetical protein